MERGGRNRKYHCGETDAVCWPRLSLDRGARLLGGGSGVADQVRIALAPLSETLQPRLGFCIDKSFLA